MIVIGLILGVFGIGFFCWLLFTLAIYALPFFAGLTAGLAAFHGGAGVLGALAVGAAAGIATLIAGQLAFAATRSIIIRAAVALLFAVPAAIAGYHATLGLAEIGVPSQSWREAFAAIWRDHRWRHGVGTDDAVRIPDPHRSPLAGEFGQAVAGGRSFGGLSLQPVSLTKRSSVGREPHRRA